MAQHLQDPAPVRRRRRRAWAAAVGALAVTGGVAVTAGGASAAPEAPTPTVIGSSAATATEVPATTATAASAVTSSAAAPQLVEQDGMPDGYTAQQYDAFWGAGYSAADADALAQLWSTDVTSAKARAGQALLDGAAVPVSPGQTPEGTAVDADPLWSAFDGAGYTYDDAVALAALWNTDVTQAKARIGQAVLDGDQLPIAPGSAPSSAATAG